MLFITNINKVLTLIRAGYFESSLHSSFFLFPYIEQSFSTKKTTLRQQIHDSIIGDMSLFFFI